ncbi:hypothetical protein AGMMS49928_16590 [Spirochaetia bacterium]|nr:hypothetical protein AGMMS49928_16590 [Spirochaetia bacterium]
MYSREIAERRSSPIEKGKPIAGTWTAAFEELDLLDIERPYRWPLSRWMRDLRIKEWQSFFVQDDRYYLQAVLSNLKHYRWAQVFLYDKETKEQLRFRKLLPFTGWRMPRSLANASVESRSLGFFFRIHNWLDADTIRVDLDIEPGRRRPSFTAHLEYDLGMSGLTPKAMPMAVSLLFDENRSMYAYKALSPVRGDMVFGGRHISLKPERTQGIFADFKGYYSFRMRQVWCSAFGFDEENRSYGFSMAENQTKEAFTNNENALWVDGRLTPLPPVRITMPEGTGGPWIIQDTEGMVDLVFNPQTPVHNRIEIFLSWADYETPLGFFNGALVDADGRQIQVHNLWGMGEKLFLRV